MIGDSVKVLVTEEIGSVDKETGQPRSVNFGVADVQSGRKTLSYPAYIYGVDHPVHLFKGRIVGVVRRKNGQKLVVVAPKNMRPIDIEVRSMLSGTADAESQVDCLYEHSCGAVVVHGHGAATRYLLIKNRRSSNWGFPKGHMEIGETPKDTARREIFEETGLTVVFLPQFHNYSKYRIGKNVEKLVEVFLAYAEDTAVRIQQSEIDDLVWLTYEDAVVALKFDNDKTILRHARDDLARKERNNG